MKAPCLPGKLQSWLGLPSPSKPGCSPQAHPVAKEYKIIIIYHLSFIIVYHYHRLNSHKQSSGAWCLSKHMALLIDTFGLLLYRNTYCRSILDIPNPKFKAISWFTTRDIPNGTVDQYFRTPPAKSLQISQIPPSMRYLQKALVVFSDSPPVASPPAALTPGKWKGKWYKSESDTKVKMMPTTIPTNCTNT